MSILQNVRDFLFPSWDYDERSLSPAELWATGADVWYGGVSSASGQKVNAESAMRAAVGKCVRLLADDISSLPVDVFDGQEPAELPRWMVTPTGIPTDMFMSYISDWIVSIGTDGNAYTLALPSVSDPQWVEVLDPESTQPLEDRPGYYRLPSGKIADHGTVLHVPWVRLPGQRKGISPVVSSRDSIGLELAAQKWAGAFFKNGGTLGGIVQVPGGPETVNAEALRQSFAARHTGEDNWWKPAVITGGAEYKDTTPTPRDADLDPLWTRVLEEAAGVYHIPPHLLSIIDTGAAARSSVEERGIGYVRHAVRPFVTRFERAHALMLGGLTPKLNLNALMRGDAKARAEYYNLMLQGKVMTRDEVRELEDIGSIGELGFLDTPNNSVRDPRTEDAGALIRAGFEPEPVLDAVGMPHIPHTGAPPVTVQGDENAGRSLPSVTDVTVNDAPTTVRIDSVEMAEDAAAQVTDATASGFERMNEGLAKRDELIVGAFGKQTDVLRDELAATESRLGAMEARLLAAEQREEERNQPENISIDGDIITHRKGARLWQERITRDETGKVIAKVAI